MDILSRKIKIPSSIQSHIEKQAFTRWEDVASNSISIFYKKDDEDLLNDKWDIITLFLERQLGGRKFLSSINELVLFTEGKRDLKSVHFFFVDKTIPKSEYLKHSLKSFKKNYHRPNEEAKIIGNTLRIDFKEQVFGNSSFWLVRQYEGIIDKARINWSVTKNDGIIIPVKFSNENSNGVIDLGDILYKMFPSNTYEFSIKSIASLVRYVFSNFATNEHYSLKEKGTMLKEEENFFDSINVKEILSRNNSRIILMEDGSNYFMSLT